MSLQTKFVISGLNFYYDGHQALKGINLDLYANEINVVFGPAGGGKSTLLRLLNRLNDLVENTSMEGQILLDGEDIYAPDIDVVTLRRRVGMVFALPIPLPGTIRGNITYGPRLSGVHSKDRLDAIVERTLRQAALWDEVKTASMSRPWPSPAGSNNGSASPASSPWSRRSSFWTRPPPA